MSENDVGCVDLTTQLKINLVIWKKRGCNWLMLVMVQSIKNITNTYQTATGKNYLVVTIIVTGSGFTGSWCKVTTASTGLSYNTLLQ